MLTQAGLIDEAIDQFRVVAKLWPDQVRFGRLILDLLQSGSTREIVHPRGTRDNGRATSGKDLRAPSGSNITNRTALTTFSLLTPTH